MSELVGTFIQFTISQLLICKDNRYSIRCSFHLLFKKSVNALWFIKVNRRVIPLMHNLVLLARSQEGQLRNRRR